MPMTPIPAEPGKKLDWIINNPAEYRVVEQIECEDGHLLSVQASGGHYCTWRWQDPPAVPAKTVEVQMKDAPVDWDEKGIEGPGAGSDMYGWVPVDEVRAFIVSHGGEKGAQPLSQLDRIEALLEQIAKNTSKVDIAARVDIADRTMAELALMGRKTYRGC